jgi:hypothetical protein
MVHRRRGSEINTLCELPDFEALKDAGLMSMGKLRAGDVPPILTNGTRPQRSGRGRSC